MNIFRMKIAAMLLVAGLSPSVASADNYQGLWWGGQADSGWNLNFSHQGDVIFALWATYDESGKATWLSMTATQTAPSSFAGTLYKTRVAPFRRLVSGEISRYDSSQLTLTEVGTATLDFASTLDGRFTYRIGGATRVKPITRYRINPKACTWNGDRDPPFMTNPTGIWFADPAGSEPGWAAALAYLPDALSFTWFTYDLDGTPTWYYGEASGVYGDYDAALLRLAGPSYLASTPGPITITPSETGGIEFAWSPEGRVFMFAGGPAIPSWTPHLTRYVFRGKGTSCDN
jgi:hypothetical protein